MGAVFAFPHLLGGRPGRRAVAIVCGVRAGIPQTPPDGPPTKVPPPVLRRRGRFFRFRVRVFVGYAARVTISDERAARIRDADATYKQALTQADEIVDDARLTRYRELLDAVDEGATHDDLADLLGVHRSRVGQVLTQAKKAVSG